VKKNEIILIDETSIDESKLSEESIVDFDSIDGLMNACKEGNLKFVSYFTEKKREKNLKSK
jgi:hypothetical protein